MRQIFGIKCFIYCIFGGITHGKSQRSNKRKQNSIQNFNYKSKFKPFPSKLKKTLKTQGKNSMSQRIAPLLTFQVMLKKSLEPDKYKAFLCEILEKQKTQGIFSKKKTRKITTLRKIVQRMAEIKSD